MLGYVLMTSASNQKVKPALTSAAILDDGFSHTRSCRNTGTPLLKMKGIRCISSTAHLMVLKMHLLSPLFVLQSDQL